jgi:hypothetical protein
MSSLPRRLAAVGIALATSALVSTQAQEPWPGVLDEHPKIQYAIRPTTDRVAALNQSLVASGRRLERDAQTGYLRSVLDALGVPVESQMLVFSKTGVQRAFTSPRTPRALYFDESVAVGYVPTAPVIEIATHDPQQGVVFYIVDQAAATPSFVRRTSCLACHVSASTLGVPGLIARSNFVGDNGDPIPQLGGTDVDHRTPHPDRWGGYFVTSAGEPAPYSQRAHAGNITFSLNGNTSNQIFVDWLDSSPQSRGYLSADSDIVALLAFDHQVRAINLMTRLNWEARVAGDDALARGENGQVRDLANELADYLLFVGEMPPSVPLIPLKRFAERLEAKTPKDRNGRSFGQLNLTNRLLQYPCSYMVYSPAFDGLPAAVKHAVYHRMIADLADSGPRGRLPRLSTEDRRAILEILRETKSDFPTS